MTYVLGLTGSIGMGKTTTARLFAQMGVPVWDADAAVHQLYASGGAAVGMIAEICPSVVVDNAIDRNRLRSAITENPKLFIEIQKIVHPLVAKQRADFIAACTAPILVLDIPLLYETGAEISCHGVMVVTAPAEVQKNRVLQRGISQTEFDTILARQMPDSEKIQRANWVVETSSIEQVQQQIDQILIQIRKRTADA
jgi:dephospho-CoA kinase